MDILPSKGRIRSFQRVGIFALFISLYVLLSSYVLLVQAVTSELGDLDPRFTTVSMANGIASRPFVYRTLVPRITHFFASHTSESSQAGIAKMVRNSGVAALLQDMPSEKVQDVFKSDGALCIYFWQYVLLAACLGGLVFSQYKLARALYPTQPSMALFAPIAVLLMIPVFKWPQVMVYDIPVVFFWSLCSWMMVGKHWKRYLCFYALALFNKESAVFMMLVFALLNSHQLRFFPIRRLLEWQLAIYVAIRVLLHALYYNNGGGEFESQLGMQLESWLNVRHYYSYYEFTLLLAVIFCLLFDWNNKPVFLRISMVVLPFLYLSYLTCGAPGEYRSFMMDLIPAISLLFTDTLIRATGFGTWLDTCLANTKNRWAFDKHGNLV